MYIIRLAGSPPAVCSYTRNVLLDSSYAAVRRNVVIVQLSTERHVSTVQGQHQAIK